MKILAAIYAVALAGLATYMNCVDDHMPWAKELFACLALLGFGFYVAVGHRLVAEQIVDWIDDLKHQKLDN